MKKGRNVNRLLALLLAVCLTLGLTYTAFAATSDPIGQDGNALGTTHEHEWEWVVDSPATCTEEGIENHVCKTCGECDDERNYGPLGHDWGDWYVVEEPGYDHPGLERRDCSRGDASETRDIPPLEPTPVPEEPTPVPEEPTPVPDGPTPAPDPAPHEHTFTETKTPGTCMQKETITRTCTGCGYTETIEGGWGDHWWDYEHPVVVQEATVSQEGITEIHCHYNYNHMFEERTPMLERTDTFSIVRKVWEDEDDYEALRPESLKVELLINDVPSGIYIILSEENGWCDWIADLPKYDTNGEEIVYGWQEEDVPYYSEMDHYFDEKDHTTTLVNRHEVDEDIIPPVEVADPMLELTFSYDDPAKALYDQFDHVYAQHVVKNIGGVPLDVFLRYTTGYGGSGEFYKGLLFPEDDRHTYIGFDPLGNAITPNTETETLLGVATITFWYVGCDPITGAELCATEKITRDYNVRKPGPTIWEIPDGSDLKVTQFEDTNSADPSGYQLGEYYSVFVEVDNISDEDVDPYSLYIPFSDTLIPNNSLNAHQGCVFVKYMDGIVTFTDVQNGYIEFLPEEATWIDPVSGNERHAFAPETLKLPVISKTGLLLSKKVKNDPANHQWFQEGEKIEWELTVYNNSKEPITNITVYDQGVVVGTFGQINPGQTETCTVPDHIVTYPDVLAGKVINKAEATGLDAQGNPHTWPSNEAKAPTSKDSDVIITKPGDPKPDPKPKDPDPGVKDPKGPVFGVIISTSIEKKETSVPKNGLYYTEGETITYEITVKNTGEVPLENVNVTDSLGGLLPIGTVPTLAPDKSVTFPFSWTVTAEDVVKTYVINSAVLDYEFSGGHKGTPVPSNKVKSPTSDKKIDGGDNPPTIDKTKLPGKPVLKDKDGNPYVDKDGKPIVATYGKADCCELQLKELGSTEQHYTLHACGTHSEAAKKAEQAAASGTAEAWKNAGDIWREEIDKMYEILYDAADSDAKTAVVNDRALFYSYIGTYEEMQAAQDPAVVQQAITEMLRMRCTELCYMIHTVPDDMPYTLLNNYPVLEDSSYATTTREIGVLEGSDSKVTDQLSPEMAVTQKLITENVRTSKRDNAVNAFLQAQGSWQIMLDSVTNANYTAADKEGRKAIAACRVMLDKVVDARRTLLLIIYDENPAAAQEALANFYRDMAMDAAENQ